MTTIETPLIPEKQFLEELLKFAKEGGVNISDIRCNIMTRLEDLEAGYSLKKIETIKDLEICQHQ